MACVDTLRTTHPAALFYLRGDFNVNCKNIKRASLIDLFCLELSLMSLPILHKSYHHFMGGGRSDSNLDMVFFWEKSSENLNNIICKLTNPLIESHHDLIITSWSIPYISNYHKSTENVVAPRIPNNRTRITWSDPGIEMYESLVNPQLKRLQDLWLQSPTRSSLSLLIQATNNILTTSATATNRSTDLSKQFQRKSSPLQRSVKSSQKNLLI